MELRLKFLDNKLLEEKLAKSNGKLNDREKLEVTKTIYNLSLTEKEYLVTGDELMSFLDNKATGSKTVSDKAEVPEVEENYPEEEEPEEVFEIEEEPSIRNKGKPIMHETVGEEVDEIDESRIRKPIVKPKTKEYHF